MYTHVSSVTFLFYYVNTLLNKKEFLQPKIKPKQSNIILTSMNFKKKEMYKLLLGKNI